MKIKKFRSNQVLKLHLLKSRAYEHITKENNSTLLTNSSLSQIVTNFKKALHIIFQYNQADKRVLFIGFPKKLELKINRRTKHVAVPSSTDLQGIFSNDINRLKSVKSSKQSFSKINAAILFPKLSKKPDLVVLLTHYKKQMIITECFISKIPLIIFNDERDLSSKSSNYFTVQGIVNSSSLTFQKTLFFFGLNFLFKKVKK